MILRLLHFFSRHRWTLVSAVSYYESAKAVFGYTVILKSCDCGAHKVMTLIGDRTAIQARAEIASLEKMVR
jgi:hypothetical protein